MLIYVCLLKGYGFVDAPLSTSTEEDKPMSRSQKKNARRKQKKRESEKERVVEFEVEEVIAGISGVTLTDDKIAEKTQDIPQSPSFANSTHSGRGIETEAPMLDDREKLKRVRNLRKKLKQIEELERRIESGDIQHPDSDQLNKISKKKAMQDELSELLEDGEEEH